MEEILDLKDLSREDLLLAHTVANKGVKTSVFNSNEELEAFLTNFDFEADYNQANEISESAYYADDRIQARKEVDEADRIRASISERAKVILAERGVDIPNVLQEIRRQEDIHKSLRIVGFSWGAAEKLVEAAYYEEVDGKREIRLKDTAEVREILKDSGFTHEHSENNTLKILPNPEEENLKNEEQSFDLELKSLSREEVLLINTVANKGINTSDFESDEELKAFLTNFDFEADYNQANEIRYSAHYADDRIQARKELEEADKIEASISEKAKAILAERGIDIPNALSVVEKYNLTVSELKALGFKHEEAKMLAINASRTTGEGQEAILIFKDTPEVRAAFEKNNVVAEKADNNTLKVKSKVVIQEGYELDNTQKNKKILQDNDIAFMVKAENERKLFVPLRGKKVATLLAASLILGPVPAIAAQIILNQTGILDKLVDKHLISRDQSKALKEGLTVKAMQRVDGKDVPQYLFLDRTTGGVNRINIDEVRIPNKLSGVELSPDQINKLKEGKMIEYTSKEGLYMAARIDLNEAGGIKSFYKEMKADKEYIDVPKPNSPDIDKLNYIGLKGVQGVNDIYGRSGANLERDSFLQKFNLKNDYMEIMAQSQGLRGNIMGVIADKAATFKSNVLDLILSEEKEQGLKR